MAWLDLFPLSNQVFKNRGIRGINMSRDDYQCNDCKNMTKADEFSCNCLCLNCGPCEDDCEYPEVTQPKEIDG